MPVRAVVDIEPGESQGEPTSARASAGDFHVGNKIPRTETAGSSPAPVPLTVAARPAAPPLPQSERDELATRKALVRSKVNPWTRRDVHTQVRNDAAIAAAFEDSAHEEMLNAPTPGESSTMTRPASHGRLPRLPHRGSQRSRSRSVSFQTDFVLSPDSHYGTESQREFSPNTEYRFEEVADETPAAGASAGLDSAAAASPPVGVLPPAFPLVVLPVGGNGQPEPDIEPGYALPPPAPDVAAGASAGDSSSPGRWRNTLGTLVQAFNQAPRHRSVDRSTMPPANVDIRRTVAEPIPDPRASGAALASQIQQELQDSLAPARAHIDRHQQALPVFSPLMVIPGAAN